MWSPEFTREYLNADYAPSDLGDAFQRFVGEALATRSRDVHTFRTLGQDGAIDLVRVGGTESFEVYEAKFTAQNDFLKAAKDAVRDVARKLSENLEPERQSSFYQPWLRQDRPVTIYWLCFNRAFPSLSAQDEVTQIVRDCFSVLRETLGLLHFERIAVKLLDWTDFRSILTENPHLALRWFEPPLPRGVEAFDRISKRATGFHSYLKGDKLPYFSPQEYQLVKLRGESPQGPEELLRELAESQEAGLIIIGPGGIGKTRMCEEIGKIAASQDWAVVRVKGQLLLEDLHAKRAFFTSQTGRYLFLFDYLEEQRETLRELIELLEDWRSDSCDVRFLGNCRPTFERALVATGKGFLRADLVVEETETRGFGDWVAGRIIERLDIADQHRARMMARGLPVLAVFLLYVKERFGADDLQRLLGEAEFVRWLVKRIAGDFSDTESERRLALLATLLPVGERSYKGVYSEFRMLLDPLAVDGWLVPSTTSENVEWGFVHDIFADELLATHLRRLGRHARFFIEDALDYSERHDCLRSSLRSFERIASEPACVALPWSEICGARLLSSTRRDAWKVQCNRLLSFRLLSLSERAALLDEGKDFWEGAERGTFFQNAIARILVEYKQKVGHGQMVVLTETLRSTIRRCLQVEDPSLLLIPAALQYYPDVARDAALRLVRNRKLSLQRKNHVFVALLEAGLPFAVIEHEVRQWLENNKTQPFAARLLIRCCRSKEGAARDTAAEFLPYWLRENGASGLANYVLRAALESERGNNSRNRRSLVSDNDVARWLGVFGDDRRARFIIEPWLRSRRRTALDNKQISAMIPKWLRAMDNHYAACWVLGPWLWECGREGVDAVRQFVIPWLDQHQQTREAQFVLAGWLKAHSHPPDRTAGKYIETYIQTWLNVFRGSDVVSFVLPKWLDVMGGTGTDLARPYAVSWLHSQNWPVRNEVKRKNFSYTLCSWLNAAGSQGAGEVEEAAACWFAHHGNDAQTFRNILPAWLKAAREPPFNPLQSRLANIAREVVRDCLLALRDTKEVCFLLRHWLRTAGPTGYDLVEPFADSWLQEYGEDDEIRFVLPSLLEAGGERALAKAERWLNLWLHANAASPDAGYLYRGALLGGLRNRFEADASRWVDTYEKFGADGDAYATRVRVVASEIRALLLTK